MRTLSLSLFALLLASVATAQVSAVSKTETKLRSEPSPFSNTITTVPGKATVNVIEAIENYVRVSYDGQTGYMSSISLVETPQLRKMVCLDQSKYLYGHSEYLIPACAERVVIGMPEKLVRVAWGTPSDVNRTVTANGSLEQLVYYRGGKAAYVYIEGGVVTTLQH